MFLLHLQWQSVSSHRVLKLTQQFGGIGGAIGYPLLSNCQCPPGGRALLMKPLQQPIARDCLLHRWLCISSVLCSSMIFPPITNTSIHQPHRHSHLKSIGVHYQGAEDTSLVTNLHWARLSPSLPTVALGQRPILLYFIFSPLPTTKTTCQCLQRSYHRVIVIHISRKDFLFQPRSKSETLPKAKRTQSLSAFSKRQHKWEQRELFLAKHLLPLFNQTLA